MNEWKKTFQSDRLRIKILRPGEYMYINYIYFYMFMYLSEIVFCLIVLICLVLCQNKTDKNTLRIFLTAIHHMANGLKSYAIVYSFILFCWRNDFKKSPKKKQNIYGIEWCKQKQKVSPQKWSAERRCGAVNKIVAYLCIVTGKILLAPSI